MNQLAFDLAPPMPAARRRDPDTSKAAASRAAGFAVNHRNRIMAALDAGPATIYEIAARVGIDHVAVARRMSELERLGQARPTNQRRDGCRVWEKAA